MDDKINLRSFLSIIILSQTLRSHLESLQTCPSAIRLIQGQWLREIPWAHSQIRQTPAGTKGGQIGEREIRG